HRRHSARVAGRPDVDHGVGFTRLDGGRGERRGHPARAELRVAVAGDQLDEPAVRAVENGQEVGARVPADGRSEALEVRLKAELPLETRRGRTERLREHQTIGPANGSPPGAGGSSGPGPP